MAETYPPNVKVTISGADRDVSDIVSRRIERGVKGVIRSRVTWRDGSATFITIEEINDG